MKQFPSTWSSYTCQGAFRTRTREQGPLRAGNPVAQDLSQLGATLQGEWDVMPQQAMSGLMGGARCCWRAVIDAQELMAGQSDADIYIYIFIVL